MLDSSLERAFDLVDRDVRPLPFKERGIRVTRELIEATLGVLNAEPTRTLPQNCRNAIMEKTPDGLDRRIKKKLNSNLRTANIVSDVLRDAGIVEIVKVLNPQIGRTVKGTRLLNNWMIRHEA